MLGPVLVHFEGFPSRADVQAVGTGEANTGHVLDVREKKKKDCKFDNYRYRTGHLWMPGRT